MGVVLRRGQARELSERGSELLEGAAERSRLSLRQRVERLALAARSIVQIAVAAALAWTLATEILGHAHPIFAPISAVIVLGLSVGRRLERAVELALGVAVGLAIADLIVRVTGVGAWQIAAILGLSMSVAVLLGSGQLFASQAAVSAILVATLPPGSTPSFERFFDSLAGGVVAIAVSFLLLPPKPLVLLRRAAGPVLAELAVTLEDVAAALQSRDGAAAAAALLRARGISELEAGFQQAVMESRETARFAPPRRGERDRVDVYATAAAQVDLAVRNVRVLARGAVRALSLDDNVPPELALSVRDLATATRALEGALEQPEHGEAVRAVAIRAAGRATLVLERTGNLSVSVLVGQVRSTATDLLRGTGMTHEDAAAARARTARRRTLTVSETPALSSSADAKLGSISHRLPGFCTPECVIYQTARRCVCKIASDVKIAPPDPPDLQAHPARARLFAALAELQTPATTGDLAARLGLHVNGVRRHLERLHRDGLVERERIRGHRGRPRDVWRVRGDVAPRGAEGARAYVDLARWLARAIPSRPGRADEIHEAGRRIGHDLAPDAAAQPGRAFVEVLQRLGFRPFAEERDGERLVCRLGRCPYAASAKESPEIICTLHRGISEGLAERLDPHARLTSFVARDPDEAGCEIEVEGLTLE